jgi:hypothetical protein
MAHVRLFWTFTFQDLSNDVKNTSMQGVLTPTIKLWVFGSPGAFQVPTFGSVNFILKLPSKWVYDRLSGKMLQSHIVDPHHHILGAYVMAQGIETMYDVPLGSPSTKSHLDVGSVASQKVYYKGEGGGFPQVWAVVSLVCPCCPWLVLTPKVLQLCINLVWALCRPMWMSEVCQLFLVPSWSFSTPIYPSKCYELGSMPRLLPLPMFSTWTHIWVPQGIGAGSPHPLFMCWPPLLRLIQLVALKCHWCSFLH